MKDQYEQTGLKQRLVDEFGHAAPSWPHERRDHALEWGAQACNPRFVVTNLDGQAQALYDDVYCQRGEAENRIKEAQIGLFATRMSCHVLRSNQLRMLLAALGYVLIERLCALALRGTALASAQVDTMVSPTTLDVWRHKLGSERDSPKDRVIGRKPRRSGLHFPLADHALTMCEFNLLRVAQLRRRVPQAQPFAEVTAAAPPREAKGMAVRVRAK